MRFLIILIVIILFFQIATIENSNALRQVAGKITFDIGPGETKSFEWGLISDNKNGETSIELSAEGEGSEFLSFEKNLILEPSQIKNAIITVSIPEDYPGGIVLDPHMIATEFGQQGDATVMNIRMLKIVNLNINLNVDSSLWVDWDKIKAQKSDEIIDPEPKATSTQTPSGGLQILQEDKPEIETKSKGGGCLIATATYGSELAPQVQQLRELRDNSLLDTKSGTGFMNLFNDVYYSFSPVIADLERENTIFKEVVKIVITPMISSLSILNYVDMDSEAEILGYGISLILLNIGMYFGIPVAVIVGIRRI